MIRAVPGNRRALIAGAVKGVVVGALLVSLVHHSSPVIPYLKSLCSRDGLRYSASQET